MSDEVTIRVNLTVNDMTAVLLALAMAQNAMLAVPPAERDPEDDVNLDNFARLSDLLEQAMDEYQVVTLFDDVMAGIYSMLDEKRKEA